VNDGSGKTEGRVSKVETHGNRGLAQGIGRESEDDESQDVTRP
jgi:hypothetical protein